MTEQFKIGFIGLGIMGAPMVRNLIKAKYEVYVYDIKQESIKNCPVSDIQIANLFDK